MDAVAAETDMTPALAREKAERYLREIAATHSPYVIDLIANGIHKLYSQGYGDIKYSEDDVRRLAALGDGDPIIFLPAHRSNLDRLSLQFMLWENDFPPNHTAGGINLNFFPVAHSSDAPVCSSSAAPSRTTLFTRWSCVRIWTIWSRSGSPSSGTWKEGGRARGS